jgi:hypothetical protein
LSSTEWDTTEYVFYLSFVCGQREFSRYGCSMACTGQTNFVEIGRDRADARAHSARYITDKPGFPGL